VLIAFQIYAPHFLSRIYAQFLNSLHLLTTNEVLKRFGSDFIGDAEGGTETKTNAILELSRGKVLIIDEAYNLAKSKYGLLALVCSCNRVI
jgi:hypothetical protein